jgi:hypothetical protein
MTGYCLVSLACFAALGMLMGCQQTSPPAQGPAAAQSRISGPYTHKNLAVFLIHGADTIKGDNYLTLGEAMEQKKLVVYETDNVNELAVENVSDQPVFIQCGDIVKGGKQDRCLGTDVIVAARSGRIPIAAFCVEAGRWRQRGAESAGLFATSDSMVVGNSMKMAGNSNSAYSDQGVVWESVSRQQQQLSRSVGGEVNENASPSSLQLTLENPQVQQNVDEYLKNLGEIPKDHNDAIGYAVVINGKISSADVYGSHALFMKVWPRLLKSSTVEAIGGLSSNPGEPAKVSAEQLRQFLAEAESAKSEIRKVNDRTTAVTYDGANAVMVQTDDTTTGSASVRRSYMSKTTDK